MRRQSKQRLFIFTFSLAATFVVCPCVEHAWAQSVSFAPGSVTGPIGAACAAFGFSPDGDILDPIAGVSLPMGPPGCGLGWAGPPAPANVDAFSIGLSPVLGVPFPSPPGSVSALFSVDLFSVGSAAVCVAGKPFFPPDIGSEAADLGIGGTSDAGADWYVTGANFGAFLPGIDFMPHTQFVDGDGAPAPPFFFPPAAGPLFGLVEPSADDIDALDISSILATDTIGPDGVPDLVPVYYSVDAPTGAAGLPPVLAGDVLTTIGGAPPVVYVASGALGLAVADDIDALVVMDLIPGSLYAPGAGDAVLFSLAPGSPSLGALDACLGLPVEAGDLLIDGAAVGAPGLCIYLPEENSFIWPARACGPGPFTGGSDNMNGADLIFPLPTPTTTTTVTTTSTTSTTTTTIFTPLCGATPVAAASCRLNTAGKGQIQYKDKDPGVASKSDKFKWKWGKGVGAVVTADFKDPLAGSAKYRVCVYDSTGKLVEMDLPPGGVCAKGKPCWKATGTKGFKYKDKSATPDGIDGAKFKEGAAGKPQVQIKGKGVNLPMPTLPLTTPITVQMLIDDGFTTECFQTTFTSTLKNDVNQVKAKGP